MLTTIIASAGFAEMSAKDEWGLWFYIAVSGFFMIIGFAVLLTFACGIFNGLLVSPLRDYFRRKD